MAKEAYYTTAGELAEAGRIPAEMISGKHLIYSSPATLSYNSPGAQGFGVKRAGLVIPESVMLLVSPACCGRNTTILADEGGYSDRMFFLQMDETDLVTGRHLTDIPEAVKEVVAACERTGSRPKVVLICITCVDALLGTDLKRVCRKAEEASGVKVLPSYMYALTREGKNPPMVAIRETIYSLLEKRKRNIHAVNLLGFFSHLDDGCELYNLLGQLGLSEVREVSRCWTFEEYQRMAEANFNLILDPEARKAAVAMEKNLGIPMAELTRLYQLDRIKRQYALFAEALGTEIDDAAYYSKAEAYVESLREAMEGRTAAIGQVVNGNPLEMALAFTKYGIKVKSVFSNVSEADRHYVSELAELDPDVRIYSTLSPSMINYDIDHDGEGVDVSIGVDAAFYYPHSINVMWNDEVQPFGYTGLIHLADRIINAVTLKGGSK